ncbi:MAG: hypothetical protein J5746_03335 [Victivallales bacterium]|nr:hypothetical protein [Victivallales bacterium]
MKGFVILVIVLIIGFIIYAAGRKQEIEKQNSAKKPPVVQKVEKPAAPAAPAKQSKTAQVSQEVQGVMNYGTGYTQVKAGNNAKSKIQNIQQQQNQRHQKALEE